MGVLELGRRRRIGVGPDGVDLVGVIPGRATTVHVHDTVAYVSDGPTLRLFNISDPTMPMFVGSFTFPQNIYSVRVAGSLAYAAVDLYGLGILDVSNPAAPALLGSFETPGQALSVDIAGTTVVVANRLSGLEVIDVSDPSAPVSRGGYFTEGYAIDVDAAGSLAYVVDGPGGLSIVDLSKSGELTAESTRSPTEQPAAVAVTTLPSTNATGATIAAVMSADSLLELFDVSDPSAPAAVGTYRDARRPLVGRNPGSAAAAGFVRVRMQGSLAFVADAYPPFTVQVVDVSDPAEPTLVTSYEPSGAPRDIAVSGSLLFVAVGAAANGASDTVLILRLIEH